MMMLLVLALAASSPPPVVVSSLQTADLAERCKGKDADPAATFCTGYILGAFDALSLSHQICPSPTRASTIRAVAVARKYLRTHREVWDSAPTFVVRTALKAEFPCKRK
ncbi:Rap1a/Tai family immunity protein [Sphingomonas sp. TREG-RG-20F-R18-01]|uniref:Rap1a/Tai family immunity protein n=1 Tax=Sphingomonas sp. TREG-RG-20F-R18-01 TaxID=2914982 RepID=UPI001F579717|nr:Rap1a/Tai family immunity protein [Sphingomonas sp. TREG-RG-20F-R18-01]